MNRHNQMAQVSRIEMADDKNVNDVDFGEGIICIVPNDLEKGRYDVIMPDVEDTIEDVSLNEAREILLREAIDDDLIIQGYGKHSGRKYWQLPQKIQSQVIGLSKKEALR